MGTAMTLVLALMQQGPPEPPNLLFINPRSSEVRMFEAPSQAVIKEVTATRDGQGLRFHVVMRSNSTSTSKEPVVLECHVLYGENLDQQRVAVIGIEGTVEETVEVPGLGTLRRRQGLLFEGMRKPSALKVEMLKSGTTFSVPVPTGEPVEWYAITRWRPSGLSADYSPGSLWLTVVSLRVFSESIAQTSVPSLIAFLKYSGDSAIPKS